MNISSPFVKRPIGTSLMAAGVLAIGILCYFLLGISALPEVSFPAIWVSAAEPGANATTMSATVTAPLERHLGQIPGIDMMRSRSSAGSAFVILLFDTDVDINAAAQQVDAAINAAVPDLPAGLAMPQWHKANPNDDPVITLALTSDTQPMSALFDAANTLLQPRLSQLPGVASVDVSGSAQPAVRVDVDLHKLTALGLSTNDIRNAITAANVTSPQGFLTDGNIETAITATDQLHSAQDFADLVIATHNGMPVFLHDVANVYEGAEDKFQAAYFNGKRSIQLQVYKRPEANVIATVDGVKDELPGLRNLVPPGTQITPYFDETSTIRNSVNDVQITLLISLSMVILTMALFLRRLAPTLIATAAVPMSLCGAFIVMYAMDYTLDNLSLLALVIALTFVVDDAIVVIENIIRHLDEGKPRLQAALEGAREIGFTIIAITASLLAVFMPILFAPSFIGMWFREFTVTIIAAIFVSMVVSLTLTPALCGRFLRHHDHESGTSKLSRALDRFHAGMLSIYRRTLDWTLHKHPKLMAWSPLVLLAFTIYLFHVLPGTDFPPQDTGLIWGRASGEVTMSFADLEARTQALVKMLRQDPAVEYVGASVGTSRRGPSGWFSIQLKPLGRERKDTTDQVVARLSAKVSRYPDLDVRFRALQDLGGGGGGTSQGGQYSVNLQSNSATELEEWLPKLQAQLQKNPMFRDVGTDLDEGSLLQNMVVDRAKATSLGVSMAAVDDALYNAFAQRQISTIYSDTNQYQVVLSALPAQTASPAALNNLYVRSSSGKMVPISAIAHQESSTSPSEIEHINQMTSMSLSFNLAPGISMGDATKQINKTIADMRMPGDITLGLGDFFRRFEQQMAMMPLLLVGAIIAVYLVLGMLYENLVHPVTILSTLPAAGVGALLALKVTGLPLSIVAIMALILLIGLVKKNAIMMIDFALVAEREGRTPLDAVREACLVRFRPIMMTTMVAILASVPLVIGFGTGADLRRPLGVAMLGGLIFSQTLTLLSTPAIYLVFASWARRRKERKAQRKERRRLAAQS
ncbi:MAG: Multidrug efflux system MdtABC-TolC, inner-membrane proton/drug antiporter MdtC (RND type) [Rhodanobacteraceae bacterium]|jgi:multidrug efflux pump|nr:MAG: Multidrug efflux system MdtABC-TolC, inner-membrane proton/drug antiporter MdtC (RND type) [Rhodanobacteraceae bacterium]